tara:strand:+ start:82 stop:351 length:270 start_codon:yes stop_codon:yes gene_type:complete
MIQVIVLIEEIKSGKVTINAQAIPNLDTTHKERQYSTILYKTLGSMGELLLKKAKDGHMITEDDVPSIVGKEIENWWDELIRQQDKPRG